jgi:hypothetical protein
MMPAGGDDRSLLRRGGVASPLGSASKGEDWSGANEAKAVKLRRNSLTRRARACGLELRHSTYGYALIDAAQKRIDGRNDMTFDEIESCLREAEGTPPTGSSARRRAT